MSTQKGTENTAALRIDRRSFLEPGSAPDFQWLRKFLQLFAVVFGLWHIVTNVWLHEPGIWQNAIHFGGFALVAAIVGPRSNKLVSSKTVLVFDVVYGVLVLAAALWVAGGENALY